MAKFELVMPKLGESIIEATILEWLKEVGDTIEADEAVLEIATDKVDSEVPSPVEGKLLEKRFNKDDVVPVGAVIAIIETEGAEDGTVPELAPVVAEPVAAEVPYVPETQTESLTRIARVEGDRFYSPLVRNIAKKEGITKAELEQLPGSGRGGRVTKKDILAYVDNRQTPVVAPRSNGNGSAKSSNGKQIVPVQEKKFSHGGAIEVVEMDRMRKLIAENMVYSKNISAHVTSYVEADVTAIVKWRQKVKADFQQQYGEKLTFTPIFIQAVVKALREHPMINASVEGNNILVKKDINIGVAVALPTDNLIVPVIKQADRLSLAGLTAAVNDLAQRARINKLKPEELEGGTYTVSNVGTFGNVMGTPIIMQPQLAILALGAIRKIPAVLETEQGDVIAIRQKMFLSHSYDHRAIDGALGGRFAKRVADILEAWDMNTGI